MACSQGFAIVAFALYVWISGSNRSGPPSDSIDYQGQPIKLNKPYASYEDYKDDPNNLAAGDIAKVQQLVKSAPVAKHYGSRQEVIDAVINVKFPGYGMGSHLERLAA